MPAASLDVGPGGKIGVVWTSGHINEVPDVYFAESTDGGVSFGPNHRAHPVTAGVQQYPDVAYDGLGTAHVFWEDTAETSWDTNIHHAATDDGGATFTLPQRVNDDPPEQINMQEQVAPAGLPDGGAVVVWMDGRENCEDNVYFAGPALSVVSDDPSGRGPGTRGSGSGDGAIRIVPSIVRDGASFRAAWVRILDAQGRLVREIGRAGDPGSGLPDWDGRAGDADALHWDGLDGIGRPVPAGWYRALMRSAGGTEARSLIVVR